MSTLKHNLKKVSLFLANLPIYKKLSGFRSASFAAHLSRLIPDGSSVLDFGCGNMYTTIRLLHFLPNLSITGLDVIRDQNLTDLTLSDQRIRFLLYNSRELPFENATFDITIALATMHHTPNPEYYLTELKRVTKTYGHIILIEEMYINLLDKVYISAQDWLLNKMKKGIPVPLNFRAHHHYLKQFEINRLKIVHASSVRPIPTFMHHYVYMLQKTD